MHLQSCLYDDREMLTEISIMIVQEISPLKLCFLLLVVCVSMCVYAHTRCQVLFVKFCERNIIKQYSLARFVLFVAHYLFMQNSQ